MVLKNEKCLLNHVSVNAEDLEFQAFLLPLPPIATSKQKSGSILM